MAFGSPFELPGILIWYFTTGDRHLPRPALRVSGGEKSLLRIATGERGRRKCDRRCVMCHLPTHRVDIITLIAVIFNSMTMITMKNLFYRGRAVLFAKCTVAFSYIWGSSIEIRKIFQFVRFPHYFSANGDFFHKNFANVRHFFEPTLSLLNYVWVENCWQFWSTIIVKFHKSQWFFMKIRLVRPVLFVFNQNSESFVLGLVLL